MTWDKASNHKRLARGEHWLLARTYLRNRDQRHSLSWKVMIMAGGSPGDEVDAIRALMPRATIVAVDRDRAAISAAIAAGVDEVFCGELGGDTICGGRFDVLCLDLCALPTAETGRLFRAVSGANLLPGGVFIGTCSYGRDVVESYLQIVGGDTRTFRLQREAHARLVGAGAPESIANRIVCLLSGKELEGLASVICYRGNAMPMLSFLLYKSRKARSLSFAQYGPGDYEMAVADCVDPSLLYATPQERIDALRRSHAAIRASYTRKERASK